MNFRTAVALLLSKYRGNSPTPGNEGEVYISSDSSDDNICRGTTADGLAALQRTGSITCDEAIERRFPQAGADVTEGYVGGLDVGDDNPPYTDPFPTNEWCAVNVHWHLGAEHRSEGEYDESLRAGPEYPPGDEQPGLRCGLYDAGDPRFTTPYEWQHCDSRTMQVGETYEVHWPHSALGDCGTKFQYQYPLTDGVLCNLDNFNDEVPLSHQVGVQAQVFTIVNDDSGNYHYDNLIDGMVVDEDREMGIHITKYTGSTTAPRFDNDSNCDDVSPLTWQVDRKCHLISASAFDKLCADVKAKDGMKICSEDECDGLDTDEDGCCWPVAAGGSRDIVSDGLAADNQVN